VVDIRHPDIHHVRWHRCAECGYRHCHALVLVNGAQVTSEDIVASLVSLHYPVRSLQVMPFSKCSAGYTRPPPQYEGHVPLSGSERVMLAVGSAFMSLYNPWRAGFLLGGSVCLLLSRHDRSFGRSNCHSVLHQQAPRQHAF